MTSHPHPRRSYVRDFREECDDIAALLDAQPESVFARTTQFKDWTVGDIIRHIHVFNLAAFWSLTDPAKFQSFILPAMGEIAKHGHVGFHRAYFSDQTDAQVYAAWSEFLPEMLAAFRDADPDARVEWAGPPMSVQSSLIARQMEHWAHAQAIYDVLGAVRVNTDRLYWIAELGVRTYSWSHKVRGEAPPRPKPYVELNAPSGAVWRWNDPQEENSVRGSAVGFAQTVTQCRNWRDTSLTCIGETAMHWMKTAQCFAGAPETPPEIGERSIK